MRFVKKILSRELRHPVLFYPGFLLRVLICRWRYGRILKSFKRCNEKIALVFLSAGRSKWKCQSVYEELDKCGRFALFVVAEEADRGYYEALGCRVTDAVGDADIIIYQDPWSALAEKYPVWKMSKRALCCYVPYSIESIAQDGRSERFDYHHLANFHNLMFACFQWSESYAKHYAKQQLPWEWAGRVLGFGHPSLDAFYGKQAEGEYVIYAPHFAFEYHGVMPISSIGTFPWSGEAILEYAKSHPEQKWIFKPHPKLRDRLVEIGLWTKQQVDAYYSEWERIGTACYDGNYAKLFLASRAMVTDSNSFLLEYMAVGKPLIHLVPERTNMISCQQAQEVFNTFYVAKNTDELTAQLRMVIEQRQDPQKDKRTTAAERAAVLGNHAGKRIAEWLVREVGGEKC